MRILNIICALDRRYGGPAEGALRLGDVMRDRGHEVDFATLEHPQASCNANLQGVAALGPLGAPGAADNEPLSFRERFAYSPDYVPWLRRHVRQYDAVLVHALWNYSTLAARRVLVATGVPYFVFPHGCLDPYFRTAHPKKDILKRLLWPFNEGVLLNGAAAVLFTTEEERLLAHNSFWPYRLRGEVVGFGSADAPGGPVPQIAAFRAALPALQQRPYLLFLSRIHPKKGCDMLIRAFARIAPKYPDLDLVMAGPDQTGWRAELEQMAEALGVANRIHWPGMIAGDLKWGAFRGCDAFALPSHSENFGIVVAEALACGRPVLLSDKVNVWREVVAAGAGLVQPDDQSGTDRQLEGFFSLPVDARAEMAAQARGCYEKNFQFSNVASRVIKLMQAVADK